MFHCINKVENIILWNVYCTLKKETPNLWLECKFYIMLAL